MKIGFVALSIILLFAVMTVVDLNAQSKIDSKIIEMEKKRLEETLDRYNNNPRLVGQSKENAVNRVKKSLQELERDPEYYFYKKTAESNSPKSKVKTGINTEAGQPVTVIVR